VKILRYLKSDIILTEDIEDRIQETEDRRQNTEDRRQNKEEKKKSRKLDRHAGFVVFMLDSVYWLRYSSYMRSEP
jgi:hypothetical protein